MENEVNKHPLQMLQHCAKVDLKIGTNHVFFCVYLKVKIDGTDTQKAG